MPLAQANNSHHGVIEGNDRFEFYYTVTLPTISKCAEIWIPIALSDDFQEVTVLKKVIPGQSTVLKDPIRQNEVLYLNLGPEASGKAIEIFYAVS